MLCSMRFPRPLALWMLAAGVTILAAGCGGGGSTTVTPAQRTQLQRRIAPVHRFADAKIKVSGRLPRGWKARRRGGGVHLRSADRGAVVAISAPAPRGQTREVLDALVSELESEYRDVHPHTIPDKHIAGRPARSLVLTATNRKGIGLHVLASAVRGHHRTYLIEVFVTQHPGNRLPEAQEILNSLKLRG